MSSEEFIVAIIILFISVVVVVSTIQPHDSIPKGCARVPIPDTCHIETHSGWCGKIPCQHKEEVCNITVVCYNGTVLGDI